MEAVAEKTIGEKRVRTSFNVAEGQTQSDIDVIKRKAAELIDLCEQFKAKDARLVALAQTSFEEGAMWAVKAATA